MEYICWVEKSLKLIVSGMERVLYQENSEEHTGNSKYP